MLTWKSFFTFLMEFLIFWGIFAFYFHIRFNSTIPYNKKRQFSTGYVLNELQLPYKDCTYRTREYSCFIHVLPYQFFLINVMGPLLSIAWFEICSHQFTRRGIIMCNKSSFLEFNSVFRRIARFTVVFLFGFMMTSIIVDTIKSLTGIPRPYFVPISGMKIDLSSPFQTLSCPDLNEENNEICRSFPSYRATLSAYSFGICLLYIHNIHLLRGLRVVKYTIHGGLTLGAFVMIFERYINNYNTLLDIFIGSLLGLLAACYTFFCILEGFNSSEAPINQADALQASPVLQPGTTPPMNYSLPLASSRIDPPNATYIPKQFRVNYQQPQDSCFYVRSG